MPTPLRNLLTLRFSLRAMLVVVTIACVVVGWRANRLWTNQRALDRMKAHYHEAAFSQEPNGAEFDGKLSFFANNNISKIRLRFPVETTPSSDAVFWRDLSGFATLRELDLMLDHLPQRLSNSGSLRRTTITHASFALCSFSGDSFSLAVEEMPQLRSLKMVGCKVASQSLAELGACRELESLSLELVEIEPDTIHKIGGKKLRRLALSGEQLALSANDFRAISEMTNLDQLSLQNLELSSTSILNAPAPKILLSELKKCKNLSVLELDFGMTPAEDVASARREMQKALPKCKMLFSRYDARL